MTFSPQNLLLISEMDISPLGLSGHFVVMNSLSLRQLALVVSFFRV